MSIVERHPPDRPAEPEPLTRADVLTATEASALLGIPRSTLYDLGRRQELRRARSAGAGSSGIPAQPNNFASIEAETWSRPSA